MLVESLERMKTAGLVYHFLERAQEAELEMAVEDAALEAKVSSGQRWESNGPGDDDARAGLLDNVLAECFMSLIYRVALSFLGIVTELLLGYVCGAFSFGWLLITPGASLRFV